MKYNLIKISSFIAISIVLVGWSFPSNAKSGLLLIDIVAMAQIGDDPKTAFKVIDTNGNGKLSEAEIRMRHPLLFSKKDVNNNGKLDPQELAIVSSDQFKSADTDRDGLLAIYEFNQADFAKIEFYDLNKDGEITYDEILELRRKAGLK